MQAEKNWLIGLLVGIVVLGCALGACLVGAAGGALIGYSAGVDRAEVRGPEAVPRPGWEHPWPGMPEWDEEWPHPPERVPSMPDMPERRGAALVLAVESGGPADKAGIRAGDLILAVDDREISQAHNLADILRDYRPDDRVRITLWRGEEETVRVRLGTKLTDDGDPIPFLGLTYRNMPAMPIPSD
jgi:membrane-associated protease RseP (regulator of RpoE activity)